VALGVLAGLLTFVPNVGPIVAAVPQALLALQVGAATVVYVIIFNVVLQTIESYLLTPMVQQYEVSLPPALTIFAQLLMAVLVGVIGIIMAAPLTAAIMVLVQILYLRDRLHDPDPGSLA
jgi:predicted PurR-regulated permease PerM